MAGGGSPGCAGPTHFRPSPRVRPAYVPTCVSACVSPYLPACVSAYVPACRASRVRPRVRPRVTLCGGQRPAQSPPLRGQTRLEKRRHLSPSVPPPEVGGRPHTWTPSEASAVGSLGLRPTCPASRGRSIWGRGRSPRHDCCVTSAVCVYVHARVCMCARVHVCARVCGPWAWDGRSPQGGHAGLASTAGRGPGGQGQQIETRTPSWPRSPENQRAVRNVRTSQVVRGLYLRWKRFVACLRVSCDGASCAPRLARPFLVRSPHPRNFVWRFPT